MGVIEEALDLFLVAEPESDEAAPAGIGEIVAIHVSARLVAV